MASPEFIRTITNILSETFADLNKICTDALLPPPPSSPPLDKSPSKFESEPIEDISVPKSEQQPVKDDKIIKKNRKKKQSIAGKPKPPPNAFVLFLQEKKFQIQGQHEGISIAAATSIASKQWNQMSGEEKQPYKQRYEENKQRYKKQKEQFYKEHPEHDPQKRVKGTNKKKEVEEQGSPNKREKMKDKKKQKQNESKKDRKKVEDEEREKEVINQFLSQNDNDNDHSL